MAATLRERTLQTALGQPQHCVWNDVKRAGTGDVNPVKCPSVACCRIDACSAAAATANASSHSGQSPAVASDELLDGGDQPDAAAFGLERKRSADTAPQGKRQERQRRQSCVRLDVRLVASEASKALFNVSLGSEEVCFETADEDGGVTVANGGGGGSVLLVFGVPVSRYASIDAFDVVLR